MRQRKFTFLLVALVVALGLLFTGGEARAAVFSYDLVYVTVTSSDFVTSASYTYNFSQTPGSNSVGYIDFEIPKDIEIPVGSFSGSTAKFSVLLNGTTPLSGEVYDIGVGDFGTKFGVGDMRYRVLKANISNPPSTFDIVLAITNQAFSSDRRLGTLEQSEQGAVLIKAGNGANTLSFTTKTPTVVNKPPDPPPAISSFSANPNPVNSGECTTLTWTGSAFTGVLIYPTDGVTINGDTAQVCPLNETGEPVSIVYAITATGSGGSTVATTDVTVFPPPAPAIEISRQTIEKKDASGNVSGNITFYFENGLPACSCSTNAEDTILNFPCKIEPLPENCDKAFTDPLLVCIPFPEQGEAQLWSTCSNGSANCVVVPVTPCSNQSGSCFARCDTMEYLTLDTTMEVGPHSCTCTTSKIRLLNGTYRTITSCSGTPCP